MNFLRTSIETLSQGLSHELLKTTPIKGIKLKKFEINLKKRSKPTHLDQWLANHVIIQCFFFCLPLFRICTDDTKYCKHGINLLLLCETGSLQLIIFEVKGFHELSICYLQVISGLFVFAVSCFKPFLGHSRLFEVVSCLL